MIHKWSSDPLTPSHRLLRLVTVFCLILVAEAAQGQPRGSLVISNDICYLIICGPHAPPPTTVQSGVPFPVYVLSLSSDGTRNETYNGTVVFSSSDTFARLPSPYTFQPSDDGHRAFTAVLFSLGNQTITVSDPGNGPTPGTLTMTVVAPTATPVPTVSELGKVALALLLAMAGLWFARARR